jgi:hypothetical protein
MERIKSAQCSAIEELLKLLAGKNTTLFPFYDVRGFEVPNLFMRGKRLMELQG